MALSVCLTFDFDAVSVWIATMRQRTPSAISRGEFGLVGARRVLELLDRHSIRSTWFIPGHTIDSFPGACEAVVAAGHEVGHHNYCHENPRALEPGAERLAIERGIAAIDRLTGQRPRGYRSPAWDHSPATLGLLYEYGFVYDSSLMAADFEPYWPRDDPPPTAEAPFVPGPRLPIVEFPVDWSLDDWPYFNVNWAQPHVGLRTPGDVYEVWRDEFDYALANHPGGVFTLTMHPQIIGRGSRVMMLERLIGHMAAQPGVEFRTMAEVADAWRAVHQFEPG
jgi:peptidoglycan/xylan/chitin deacetylase (PgdA/CDA1 family)